ncbi:Pyrroline-5-carboxylate reductase 3 [Dissostichus eleginoides]|uniref:Pyrroline-5-carboxylate reductase 3 n=1 Tax=Dissostichus eleginoides TaxID=100907 RepID=A0AAD9FJG6_DISEL|nr:Pyrroline-5-carboxylate reductase 3 [Dissostichus eleginoides]
MGSVRPPTLSDLSPLKVRGSCLSHEDKTIVQQSGGRPNNHAWQSPGSGPDMPGPAKPHGDFPNRSDRRPTERIRLATGRGMNEE